MDGKISSLERDTLSRSRIVSEIGENFFVEAGAGSGKTTMLVNRMVAMVEAGIGIEKICAITFTKAAAGEFYDRFQKTLIERSGAGSAAAPVVRDAASAAAPTGAVPAAAPADAAPAAASADAAALPGSLQPPTDRTRELCSEALKKIDLCFMGTIDAFCGMVLSEHPSEAGIPSDSSIVSDEDAAVVYKQQYVKICAGEYGEELKALSKTFQALHRGAQDVFVKGISFLMDNRNVCFHFHEAEAADIDKDFARDRQELIRALKCLLDHPELKYSGNAPSREAWDSLPDTYNAIRRRWSSNYPGLLYALKSLKNIRLLPEAADLYAVSLGSLFVPGGKGKKPKWLEYASPEEGGICEKLEKLRYDASMTFLAKCVPVMEQAMRDKGMLTFFDYLYYLRNMLRKDAEGDGKLIRYIYDRHSYFLIDEFQDTNPLQAEVFFYLSSEHPVPKWSECVPRKGSLFIVGDPKQSIYRFRSADVTSFLKVKRLFEANGGAILSLSRNFRSTRMLCEYYNRVFADLLPEETVNQSRFEEIPLPEATEGEFQGVYSYKAYVGKAAAENPDMSDPVMIADIIERLVNNRDYQLRGKTETAERPIRYSDFMVITYGKKKLGPIMAELDARDIPTRVEGDVPFAENEALRGICSIFTAVADADDTLALYGALTGKLIALTKEEILRYRAAGGTVSLRADTAAVSSRETAARRVLEKIEGLRDLHRRAARLSPAALFARIMDEFRVYRAVSTENPEVVYYALELMRNAERSGQVVSLKDGAMFLAGLIAGLSGEERCLSLDSDKDCVHMANLHKVKGLEAPIIILAAASDRVFPATCRMTHGEDSSDGYLFSLGSERGENGRSQTYFRTDEFEDEKEEENEALKAEDKRLVYVAATRARNALILCDSTKVAFGREMRDSKWGPIMEEGLPDILEVVPAADTPRVDRPRSAEASVLYEMAEAESVMKDRSAEAASFRSENPSRQVMSKLADSGELTADEMPVGVLSADEPTADGMPAGGRPADEPSYGTAPVNSGAEREAGADSLLTAGPGYPALLGTMTHKLLEMMVISGNRLDIDPAVGEIIREFRAPGTERYEDRLAGSLRKVAGTMRAGGYAQTNGLPQDLLATLLSADEVYCELPFSYMDEPEGGRTVWNGVMDVVYLADGRWHIVDYKTNADGTDLDLKYQGQLAAYIKAFKATTGFDADAKTYHIDI